MSKGRRRIAKANAREHRSVWEKVMLVVHDGVIKYVKCLLAKELSERVAGLAVIALRCLCRCVTCRVAQDVEWGAGQKVRVNYGCVCKERLILQELFLVVKADDCIGGHLSTGAKCRWDQVLGDSSHLAQVLAYIHRAPAPKADIGADVLAFILLLYSFNGFNSGIRGYLIVQLVILYAHIVQPPVVNVGSGRGNYKSILRIRKFLYRVFAEHDLLRHQYFPSHMDIWVALLVFYVFLAHSTSWLVRRVL